MTAWTLRAPAVRFVMLAAFVWSTGEAAVGRTPGTFAVAADGAASYSIPLWTPPGVNGLKARLALVYNSNAGNGLLGQGWGVAGLSTITRCRRTWEQDGQTPAAPGPVELSMNDRFCLDGQRLRLASGSSYGTAGTTYRTEIESFARVTANGTQGSGPQWFQVETKDGLIYQYGYTADSRIEAGGVVNNTVLTWAVNKISDRAGNSVQFVYDEDSNGTYRIDRIDYPYTALGGGPYYQVKFVYVSRTDVLNGYAAGNAWQEPNRLDYIDVEAGAQQLRRYDLSWEYGAATGRSRIASVQECVDGDCLQPTTIDYQDGAAGWATEQDTGQSVASMANAFLMDFNGDGRDDLVYPVEGGNFYVMLASGSGFGGGSDTTVSSTNYAAALPLDYDSDGRMDLLIPRGDGNWHILVSNGATFTDTDLGIPATGAGGNAMVADYTGDGRPDLMYAVNPDSPTSSAIKGRAHTGSGFGSEATLWAGSCAVRVGAAGEDTSVFGSVQNQYRADLRTSDFNGDGRVDLALRLATYSCSPEFPWGPVHVWVVMHSTGTALDAGTAYTMGEATPSIADVDGDGLTDVMTPGATHWIARHSTGAGALDSITTSVPIGTVAKAKFADWDGDGRTDILTSVGNSYFASRSTGTGFETAVGVGIPDDATVTDVKIGDIDGDGLTDWVYRNNSTGRVMFRLHQGERADLATAITDGFGIAAQPTYTSIAQGSYTKGSGAGFPYLIYQGPRYVVSSVSASTGTGGTYTQTYTYEGAQIHLQGRGFLGFHQRKMTDSRDGLYRRETSNPVFPYGAMLTQSELRQSNDTTIITRTVNTLTSSTFGAGNDVAYFPYVSTAVTDTNEFGGVQNGAPASNQTTSVVVDNFGNPTTVTVSRQDLDAGSPWVGETFQLQTTSSISNDTTAWCLGLPNQTVVRSTLPDGTWKERTTSATIDYQVCRVTAQTVEPNDTVLRVHTSFGFDGCGNVNSETVTGKRPNGSDMAPRNTSRNFGTRCQLPETVTNALGQATTIVNDYGLGLPQTVTDPNGLAVTFSYDAFGRADVTTRVDGTDTDVDFVACSAGNAYCGTGASDVRWQQQSTQRDTVDAAIRTDFVAYDGLDRPRALSTQLVGGAYSTVTRTYDAAGRLAREYVPTTMASNGYRQFSYDALGRVLADALHDSGGALYRQATFEYAGRRVTTTNPPANGGAGNQMVNRYFDVRGKLRRVQEPAPGGTTNYGFDHFGNLASVTDAGNATTSWTYNLNGYLTAMSHPDRGNWSYGPNSLGELVNQTNAKGQTMSMTRDTLGRPLTRTEPEGTTTWTWGTVPGSHEIGRLRTVSGFGYSETYSYDAKGRLAQTTIGADATYDIIHDYNAAGLPDSLTYPASTGGSPLRIRYGYDHGILNQVADYDAPQTVFWRLNTVDAGGRAIDESLGSATPAIGVISSYDPLTGLIESRTAGAGSPYTNRQNLSFEWDVNGNLKKRADANQGSLNEEFYYDALNRLDSSRRNGATNLDLSYFANGNIDQRWEGGVQYAYFYSAGKPHALSQTQYSCSCGECIVDAYGYDANGNMTSRLGSSISWYSYDLPNAINQGDSSSQFYYTPNRSRWKQVASFGGTAETTIYVGGILEKVTRGGVTEYKHFIPAGAGSMAIHTRRSAGSPSTSTYYVTRDSLGSATAVMDANGASLVNLSFAAFGGRRGAAWQDVPSTNDWNQITATTRRGFTGHEHLDSVSLIHMNGRVYDPKIGRFLSGDPVLGDVASPQSLNPYSYANNNPGTLTDPSGFRVAGDTDALIGNVDYEVATYRAELATWAGDCRGSPGACNNDPPSVAGIVGAAQSLITMSVGTAQAQNRAEIAAANVWSAARSWTITASWRFGVGGGGWPTGGGPGISVSIGDGIGVAIDGSITGGIDGYRDYSLRIVLAFRQGGNAPRPKPTTDAPYCLASVCWPTPTLVVTDYWHSRRAGGRLHDGVDIRARRGFQIFSTQAGTVTKIDFGVLGGNQIYITNSDGSVSIYSHTQPYSGISEGVAVESGQVIGRSDGSGGVHPHLHYIYKLNGSEVDPLVTQLAPFAGQWRFCGGGIC